MLLEAVCIFYLNGEIDKIDSFFILHMMRGLNLQVTDWIKKKKKEAKSSSTKSDSWIYDIYVMHIIKKRKIQ